MIHQTVLLDRIKEGTIRPSFKVLKIFVQFSFGLCVCPSSWLLCFIGCHSCINNTIATLMLYWVTILFQDTFYRNPTVASLSHCTLGKDVSQDYIPLQKLFFSTVWMKVRNFFYKLNPYWELNLHFLKSALQCTDAL